MEKCAEDKQADEVDRTSRRLMSIQKSREEEKTPDPPGGM